MGEHIKENRRNQLGYGSSYRKGSRDELGAGHEIGSVLGGQVWMVRPDKGAEAANPCLWMQAGVVNFKNCTIYDPLSVGQNVTYLRDTGVCNFYNCSVNVSDMYVRDSARANIYWFYHVYVRDNLGNPMVGMISRKVPGTDIEVMILLRQEDLEQGNRLELFERFLRESSEEFFRSLEAQAVLSSEEAQP